MNTSSLRRSTAAMMAAVLTPSLLLAVPAQAPVTNIFDGTWTLNLSKSKFDPGPAPESVTMVFTSKENVLSAAVDFIRGRLNLHWAFSGPLDGKDYPAQGNLDVDQVSLKRIDARTIEIAYKNGGKTMLTNKQTVSADGKTMTVASTGINARGARVTNVALYDKKR